MSAPVTRSFSRGWAPWAALIGVGWLAAAGCFSPKQPACAFTCLVAPNRCPENYACGEDGLCHRSGADTACTLTPPAPTADAGDSGTADGTTDADDTAADASD